MVQKSERPTAPARRVLSRRRVRSRHIRLYRRRTTFYYFYTVVHRDVIVIRTFDGDGARLPQLYNNPPPPLLHVYTAAEYSTVPSRDRQKYQALFI